MTGITAESGRGGSGRVRPTGDYAVAATVAGTVAGMAGRGHRAVVETAAVTAATLVGLAGVSWAGLVHQIHETSTLIDAASKAARARQGPLPDGAEFSWQAVPPRGDGVYLPDGTGPLADGVGHPLVLTMLGDSTAVGYGCATADELPGVVLARGVAAALGRPVRTVTHGVVGSGGADLARQTHAALPERPDVAVIVVGSNDVRDHIPPRRSAAQLGKAVAALRAQSVPVVVGTCPDLGVITPIPQPLRHVVALWSRRLAVLQGRAVRRAGGVPVPIDRLVSPDFYGRPDLFYADGFHPSGPGYAKAVAALLPRVLEALQQPAGAAPGI